MNGRFLKAAIGAIVAFGAAVTAAPARAERLIVSVSNHRVTVTPNYSGEELVLLDRKSTRLNSSHRSLSRMPSSA